MAVGVFGLGGMEILILLALMLVAASVIAVVTILSRRSGGPSIADYNALLNENDRLRAENERLKRDRPASG